MQIISLLDNSTNAWKIVENNSDSKNDKYTAKQDEIDIEAGLINVNVFITFFINKQDHLKQPANRDITLQNTNTQHTNVQPTFHLHLYRIPHART